ncbi:MAG: metal-sensitive transcriptional regulator [Kiritimatiellae bacterium]|nr:metal-sensitive transcriptional regulator [Kiritimatiellia bacterium]
MKKKHETTHEENLNRVARIEGQVRGIRRMIEDGAYCVDIITQIQAVCAALQGVGRRVLRKHMEHCMADALKSRSKADIEEKIQEVMRIIERSGKVGS